MEKPAWVAGDLHGRAADGFVKRSQAARDAGAASQRRALRVGADKGLRQTAGFVAGAGAGRRRRTSRKKPHTFISDPRSTGAAARALPAASQRDEQKDRRGIGWFKTVR